MATLQPRWIIGKTVASVDMCAAPDDRGGTVYEPIIRFTDGSCVMIMGAETEYGVACDVQYCTPPKRKTPARLES